jgi:hypothetical protein
MYLPRLLADLGPLQSARLKIFQLRITTLIIWATRLLRPHFEALGIDNNTGIRRGLRMQNETLAELKAVAGGLPRGVLAQESRREEALNSLSIDLFFPPLDATPPAWQRTMLAGLYRTAQIGDHLLKWIS